jgi:hypothetical protein
LKLRYSELGVKRFEVGEGGAKLSFRSPDDHQPFATLKAI